MMYIGYFIIFFGILEALINLYKIFTLQNEEIDIDESHHIVIPFYKIIFILILKLVDNGLMILIGLILVNSAKPVVK